MGSLIGVGAAGLAGALAADDNGADAPVQPHPAMIIPLADLVAMLAPNQRLLGIDPGSKLIGVALSDVRVRVASPYGTLRRGRLTVNAGEIMRIVRRENVGGLVVGFPLSMDGTLGPAAQAARDWTRALSDATGLPAALWDERMSTAAVHDMLIGEADMGRRRRAEVVDRMAAAYILQMALDAHEGRGALPPGPKLGPEAPDPNS
jgi:putative Holliday junction resolvase